MKTPLCYLTLVAGTCLWATMPLFGQSTSTAAPPARSADSPNAPPPEEKEKAEDAALLQQLQAEDQSAAGDVFEGGRGRYKSAGRAGGIAGPMGGPVARVPPRNQVVRRLTPAAPRALLVRTSNPEPKAQADLEEDLAVMAHLLHKAIGDVPGGLARPLNVLGVDLAFPNGSAPIRSLYLENYGALFFLSVGFPLVAPPEEQPEEKPAGDSAWEDAREELYGQRGPGTGVGERGEDYDQAKVDQLKQTLLESLKNATNIRGLKPDELVTLWVAGGGTKGNIRVLFKNNPPGTLGGNFMTLDQPGAVSRRTVLTMCASKKDIDAYAKGSLSTEQFRKSAKITAYTEDAGAGMPEGLGGGGVFYSGRNRF